MSEFLNEVLASVDRQHSEKSAATRRQLVAGAGAALGTLGVLGWAQQAEAALPKVGGATAPNTPQTIVNVAATAEVLATIVNTVGAERVTLDAVTRANIRPRAARRRPRWRRPAARRGRRRTRARGGQHR